MADYVWVMTVEDLTSVGGPMGTENVHTIKTVICDRDVVAFNEANKDYQSRKGSTDVSPLRFKRQTKTHWHADALAWGYHVRREVFHR